MARNTLVSWRTFALLLLFPPLGVAVLLASPLIAGVVLLIYLRGKWRERGADDGAEEPRTVRPRGTSIRDAYE